MKTLRQRRAAAIRLVAERRKKPERGYRRLGDICEDHNRRVLLWGRLDAVKPYDEPFEEQS